MGCANVGLCYLLRSQHHLGRRPRADLPQHHLRQSNGILDDILILDSSLLNYETTNAGCSKHLVSDALPWYP